MSRVAGVTYDEVFAAMLPFVVLLVSFLALRSIGLLGVPALDDMDLPPRIALFLMMVGPNGFEPSTSSVSRKRSRPTELRAC